MSKKTRRPPATLDERITLIAGALEGAKARTIKRITRRLERLSLNDVAALERLLGGRRR